MSEWLEIFGGNTIKPTFASYQRYSDITGTLALEWALEAASGNIIADFMQLSSSADAAVQMPDARTGSTGPVGLLYNSGSGIITIKSATGAQITTLSPGLAAFLVLADNTVESGSWVVFAFGSSASAAQASALSSANIVAVGGTLQQSLPVLALSSDYTIGANERAALVNWTGGVGTITVDGADSVGQGWFSHLRNSGDGALTIAPGASDTIDSATSLILNPGDSTLLVCDGDNFFTVAKASAPTSTFSYLSIDVSGTGDYTLSGAQQGYDAYRFSGTLTGNRNIIVPTALAEFVARNETSGSYTFTVKTAAGTGTTVGTNESKILYCDGTNIKNAATAGISTPVQVSEGGTGATSASAARTNLGATSVGNALFTAASAAAARGAVGLSSVGDAVVTAVSTLAARAALGAGAIGDTLFQAATAAIARGTLGITATGDAIVTAANDAAVRTAAGITTIGTNLVTAASATAARVALGAGAFGETLFQAASLAAAKSALAIANISDTLVSVAGYVVSYGTNGDNAQGTYFFGETGNSRYLQNSGNALRVANLGFQFIGSPIGGWSTSGWSVRAILKQGDLLQWQSNGQPHAAGIGFSGDTFYVAFNGTDALDSSGAANYPFYVTAGGVGVIGGSQVWTTGNFDPNAYRPNFSGTPITAENFTAYFGMRRVAFGAQGQYGSGVWAGSPSQTGPAGCFMTSLYQTGTGFYSVYYCYLQWYFNGTYYTVSG